MHRIAIVGGGAAGIFSALGVSEQNEKRKVPSEILLFERNPRLGIKILISGGGKCNITHAGPIEQVLRDGFPRKNEQRFLKHAFHSHTNEDVLRLLDKQGVAWHSRENGRIFPDSSRAEDVLVAFENALRECDVQVHTSSRVLTISQQSGKWKIKTEDKSFIIDALILTTGGVSYSKTGTTGDGIKFARLLDHAIAPLRSALAPIYLARAPGDDLQGIAIRSSELILLQSGKRVGVQRGDVLITHRGLSGPAALDISRQATELLEIGPVSIQCNLLRYSQEALRNTLLDWNRTRQTQQVSTALDSVLPNAIVPHILEQANISKERKWNALTRDERRDLERTLLGYDFGVVSEIPLERGEVTAGGVALTEVDGKTMMSKKLPGLFFAGEMLDVAGEIGGYNLQAAYSTGWLAGLSAAKYLANRP
jgi:predicted Rossmann fold flavoprotein